MPRFELCVPGKLPAMTILTCLFLAGLLPGCSETGRVTPDYDAPQNHAKPVPLPSELTRSTSSTYPQRIKVGSRYDSQLPHPLISRQDALGLEFNPDYLPDADPPSYDLSMAFYWFTAAGFGDLNSLGFGWLEAPEDPGDMYIGLADWANDSWKWIKYDGDPSVPTGPIENYRDTENRVCVALVFIGDDRPALSWISLGVKDGRWITETIDTMTDMSEHPVIDCSYIGAFRCLYTDHDTNALIYAYRAIGDWDLEAVGTDRAMRPSMALGSDRYLRISYYEPDNGDLKFLKQRITDWQEMTIASTNDYGSYSAIVLDDDDDARIACYYTSAARVVHYTQTVEGWIPLVVDLSGDVGRHIEYALDSNDHGRMSYYDDTNNFLRFTYWDGDSWEKIAADENDQPGATGISLTIDDSDTSHIAYSADYEVRCASISADGSSTSVQTVTELGGLHVSIAADSDDILHLAFIDDEGHLRYCSNDGTGWVLDPEVIDSQCSYTAIDHYRGLPMILYGRFTDGGYEPRVAYPWD